MLTAIGAAFLTQGAKELISQWPIMNTIKLAVFLIFIAPAYAEAQSINVKVAGVTEDKLLEFSGSVRFNVFLMKGRVTGHLNTAEKCDGHAKLNGSLSSGGGNITCGPDLSARFEFILTSRLPVKGYGTAILNDGRKAELTLWQ